MDFRRTIAKEIAQPRDISSSNHTSNWSRRLNDELGYLPLWRLHRLTRGQSQPEQLTVLPWCNTFIFTWRPESLQVSWSPSERSVAKGSWQSASPMHRTIWVNRVIKTLENWICRCCGVAECERFLNSGNGQSWWVPQLGYTGIQAAITTAWIIQ